MFKVIFTNLISIESMRCAFYECYL